MGIPRLPSNLDDSHPAHRELQVARDRAVEAEGHARLLMEQARQARRRATDLMHRYDQLLAEHNGQLKLDL